MKRPLISPTRQLERLDEVGMIDEMLRRVWCANTLQP